MNCWIACLIDYKVQRQSLFVVWDPIERNKGKNKLPKVERQNLQLFSELEPTKYLSFQSWTKYSKIFYFLSICSSVTTEMDG